MININDYIEIRSVKLGQNSIVNASFVTSSKIMKVIVDYYHQILKLNIEFNKFNGRKINIPEFISETIVAYELNFGRTNGIEQKKLNGTSVAMDAVDMNGNRYEIKAGQVSGGTLTSFSPNNNYDELIYVDFSTEDDNVTIYRIEKFDPKNIKVNEKETFYDHQISGRRPRFNIIKKIQNGELKVISKVIIDLKKY